MRLTDNEKRDALKYIQEGKSLPDKYRFLLFKDDREVELMWNGKTQEVSNLVLPFQTIEHIDEPRSKKISKDSQLDLFDTSGRQIKGWTNKLVWGDNKLILSSLKNGPMRKEIEKQGGLKLIYIDPPFDVGADFSMNVEIGDDSFTKKPSVIEEVAYRDTWGKGADSFISMIYERLKLMQELLSDDGSIYVHCDWRLNSCMRLVLDEIFGSSNFRSEIIWNKLTSAKSQSNYFSNVKDSIFHYTKSNNALFNPQFIKSEKDSKNYPYIEERTKRKYGSFDFTQKGNGPTRNFGDKGLLEPPAGKHWIWSQDKIDQGIIEGRIIFTKNGLPRVKRYLDEKEGNYVGDLWVDDQVAPLSANASERMDYPTQKPEKLIERIIDASSGKGDLVADFFCGSGTTLSVAEKTGRKWIGADLGRFSIHTSRKRLIQVQRELKQNGKNFRAFEILNLGKYEREHYLSVDMNIREQEKQQILEQKEKQFIKLILSAYKAQAVDSYNSFVGKKRDRLVAVGPINTPVSAVFVDEATKEAIAKGITKFDILGFDYEMGIDFAELSRQGVDIQFKVIPREVFDRKAVEKGHVKFYDVAYIEVKPIIKGRGNNKVVTIELCDFSVFYNQDSVEETENSLKEGSSKIVIENGQVIKVSKDKKTSVITKEVLTKKWTDWMDYWSVDFDIESKKEIVHVIDPKTSEEKEEWTGGYIFENEWQSFRTKKDRTLELVSAEKEVSKGCRKIAVKVVDIFGNDTTKVIEVNI